MTVNENCKPEVGPRVLVCSLLLYPSTMPKTTRKHHHHKSRERSNGSSSHHHKHKKRNVDSIMVTVADAASSSITPLVCSFPSGLPQSLVLSSSSQSDSTEVVDSGAATVGLPKFLLKRDHSSSQKGVKNRKMLLVGKDQACLYRAEKGQEQSSATTTTESRTRVCVGVLDKQSNVLTLHPTSSSGVWALSQSVPSYRSSTNTTTTMNTATVQQQQQQQANRLFADFGSSKKRRVLKSQQANRVHVEQVVGGGSGANMLLSAMSESNRQAVLEQSRLQQSQQQADDSNTTTTPSTSVQAATDAWRRDFLPKYNATATTAHEIYKPSDICGSSEAWSKVRRIVDACLYQENVVQALIQPSQQQQQQHDYDQTTVEWPHASIVRLVQDIDNDDSSDTDKRQRFQCAFVLNFYSNLYLKWHRKRFIRLPHNEDHPLVMTFLQQFAATVVAASGDNDSSSFGYCMSKTHQQKCLVHLLLLFLWADSSSSTTSSNQKTATKKTMQSHKFQDLARDLQVDAATAAHLLRQAGCTVVVTQLPKKQMKTATLSTPLTFPHNSSGGRGKNLIGRRSYN